MNPILSRQNWTGTGILCDICKMTDKDASSGFRFKQFTVLQDLCAMKVGTDGVLIGAWAPIENAHTILDVGTGTGLISLMLAQRSDAAIHAVDIDECAVQQAEINFENSPWSGRLQAEYLDFAENNLNQKYDLICSNPPYFFNSLKTPDEKRNLARHQDSLPLQSLFSSAERCLSCGGTIAIILPFAQLPLAISSAAQAHLLLNRVCFVLPTPAKAPSRVLLTFRRTQTRIIEEILIIEMGGRHSYSEDFKRLTRKFYLKH